MAQRKGTVTLFEGKSKKDGKPYKALLVKVGEWDTLYFVNSKFEMKYLEEYLTEDSEDDKLFDREDDR